ncbi:MAG: [protein-PII] uridylyltransferase [Zetaproteobacteria bacterium]|nr:[protein-PII] uridylyltransferase [Zetaproteobacteria bacterium]
MIQNAKVDIAKRTETMQQMFREGQSGAELSRWMSNQVDNQLVQLWKTLAPKAATEVDLIAVGGYGRGELAPFSDWDIWFVLPKKSDEETKAEIQTFLYFLWDLNVKIGYAVRTLKEAYEHLDEDWEAVTACMEMRLLAGSGGLFQNLNQHIRSFLKKRRKMFILAKIDELEARHQRTGNTAFMMEPDVKEGQGGLRDVQSMFWMCKAWSGHFASESLWSHATLSKKEYEDLVMAQNFLWRVRVGLHLQSHRLDDRLSYEKQVALAQMMGYQGCDSRHPVDHFMKDYFRYAGRIARILSMLLMHFEERLYPKRFALKKNIGDGFVVRGNLIGLKHPDVFKENPLRLLQVFHLAQIGHRRLSSDTLRQIRADVLLLDDQIRDSDEAKSIFIEILQNPRNVFWTLKRMNDTGVLGRFIPEFRDVVGLGQFNRYHVYTVDEHTIRAVGEARNMLHEDRQTRLTLTHDVIRKLKRPELLYIALIFHDIAKGLPGDHSIVGAGMAHAFCERLGLSEDASALVGWLVREHLSMAMISQRSDLSDPEVIRTFANLVGDQEHLDYLLCLTVADIAAVGPNVWNDWKGTLLKDLYQSTELVLLGDNLTSETINKRIQRRIDSAIERLKIEASHVAPEALRSELLLLPQRCILHFPPRQLRMLGAWMSQTEDGEGVGWHIDQRRSETLLMILTHERRGLFAALTASIASGYINVVAAEAYGLDDGRVLDIFHVHGQNDQPLTLEDDLKRLKQRLEITIAQEDFNDEKVILKPFKPNVLQAQVKPYVCELPLASSRYTAIEVSAANRPGLLADLAQIIAESGCNLRSASISSFGERVVDVFFVQGSEEDRLTASALATLCAQLLIVATIQPISK